ncbi:Fc.00g011210.m01.CDS01 [Cosmosporella sp. VM-42]
MVSPVMFNALGWKTYIVYATFNAVAVPMVYFCYPETAYGSLEEIDAIFAKSTGIFDVVMVAQAEPMHFDKHGETARTIAADVQETVLGNNPEKGTDICHLENLGGN